MQEIHAGRVIGSKYELVRLLGRGSMGEVWLAHHQSLHESVAIKLLSRSPPGTSVEYEAMCAARFRLEAQIAARLSRKTRHIVRVTDNGEEGDGLAYLVMELLEGQTLEDHLEVSGALAPSEVARLVAQIARALEGAHAEGIVHRDLKPANVFLTTDEDAACIIKLLDFGIARAMRTQRATGSFSSTSDGLIFGTPGYMSPEQACGSKIDSRCDLWALATVAYEALSGALPVSGGCVEDVFKNLYAWNVVKIHERRPDLPVGLQGFFERALAFRVEDRFASASELSLAFERAVGIDRPSLAVAPTLQARGLRSDPPGIERPMSIAPPPIGSFDPGSAPTLLAAQIGTGPRPAGRMLAMAFPVVLAAVGVGMVAMHTSHADLRSIETGTTPSTPSSAVPPTGPTARSSTARNAAPKDLRLPPSETLTPLAPSEALTPLPTMAIPTEAATEAALATQASASAGLTATVPAAASAASDASSAPMHSAPKTPAPRPSPPPSPDRSAVL